MAFLDWQEAYSVKVPELDQQHQRLVGMLNRLHDALRAGGDPAVAQKVVEELVLYTQHHFAAEERLMETSG
ncbi:MAG: hemerythrin domain-containing protein [Bryobacteraceae bacterium]|nr:hemerythrin domain-containing protein [Bryobacteraceae bacterium]